MTDYYVATTGDDDVNNGLSPTDEGGGVGPFATPAKAFTTASWGDNVYILAGTYNDITGWVSGNFDNFSADADAWKADLDLSSQAYMTIQPYNDAEVIFGCTTGTGSDNYALSLEGDSTYKTEGYFHFKDIKINGQFEIKSMVGIIFENIEAEGSATHIITEDTGCSAAAGCGSVTIKNCKIHKFDKNLTTSGDYYTTIDGCDVSDWGQVGIRVSNYHNITIKNCDVHDDNENSIEDGHFDGIYLYGGGADDGQGALVESCRIYNITTAGTISLFVKNYGHDIVIRNCFVWGGAVQLYQIKGLELYNNTFGPMVNFADEQTPAVFEDLTIYNNIFLYGCWDQHNKAAAALTYSDYNIYSKRFFTDLSAGTNSFEFGTSTVEGESIYAGNSDWSRSTFMKNYMFDDRDTNFPQGQAYIKSYTGDGYARDWGTAAMDSLAADCYGNDRTDGSRDVGCHEYPEAGDVGFTPSLVNTKVPPYDQRTAYGI